MVNRNQLIDVVHRSDTERECREYALVLRAVGIECAVRFGAGEYVLVVASEHATRAAAELSEYAHENRRFQTQDSAVPQLTDGVAGVFCYATIILLVAVFKGDNLFALDWMEAGKTSAQLIREGQWWRTITALTLHADATHLLSNLVVGGLFGLFAAQMLGTGVAWIGILIGGSAGNAINALLRTEGHTSVGASTAIFAALGIVAAYAWAQRRAGRALSLKRWTPMISGVVLLGFLGTGGARTDVAAHVAGFVCGVLIGAACAKFGVGAKTAERTQAMLAVGALAILILAWSIALVEFGGK